MCKVSFTPSQHPSRSNVISYDLLVPSPPLPNAMAAALMAFAAKVKPASVQKGFDKFKAIEHRIEPFANSRGIKFFNDSKSTNIDSTLTALKAFAGQNLWLILGGQGKGAPYGPLAPHLKTCREVVLIGQDAPIISKELRGAAPMINRLNIDGAVEYILAKAKAGDIVLLSPACASFDQFNNYEERGRHFKKAVLSRLALAKTSRKKSLP